MEKEYKGVVTLASHHSVKETMDRLEASLRAKGVTIFARIDQQAEAEKSGSGLAPIELLIFGNPKAGTLLMAAEPLSGLDLPLKALAWQDGAGRNWLSYNSFEYLQERFALPEKLVAPLGAVKTLLEQATV